MKKTFIALAVLGAVSSFALADSNVTLYGKVEMGPAIQKTKGSDTSVSLGANNFYGSRWGIRGTEDLGGGNVIGFQLEQGYSPDTGSASSDRAFHRTDRLYVAGDWGEVGLGRWGALSSGTGPYEMISTATWMWDACASFETTGDWTALGGNFTRANNAIIYVTPNIGGLTVAVMYSNGMTDDNTDKWSKNSHYYGIGATYKAGGLASNLIFEVRDNKEGGGSLALMTDGRDLTFINTDTLDDEGGPSYDEIKKPFYNLNFGIAYDFGMIRPQFGYGWSKQANAASQHQFGLSASAPVAGGTFVLGTRYAMGSLDGQAKSAARSAGFKDKYGLVTVNMLYDYPISKRTEVYAYAGWTKGTKLYSRTGMVSGPFGSTINSNGYMATVAMVHNF